VWDIAHSRAMLSGSYHLVGCFLKITFTRNCLEQNASESEANFSRTFTFNQAVLYTTFLISDYAYFFTSDFSPPSSSRARQVLLTHVKGCDITRDFKMHVDDVAGNICLVALPSSSSFWPAPPTPPRSRDKQTSAPCLGFRV